MNTDHMLQYRQIVNDCVEQCINGDMTPRGAIDAAMDGNEFDSELLRRYMASLVSGWISVIYAFEDLKEQRNA